jgi:hypothetical protein
MPTYLFDTKPRPKHEIQQLINYYYRKGGGTYSGAAQAYAQENNTNISAFNELVRQRDYYKAHPEEEPEPAQFRKPTKPLETYTLKEIQDIINYYFQKGNGTYEGAAINFTGGPEAFNQLVAYRNYLQKNPDKAPKYPISDEQYQKITQIVETARQRIINNSPTPNSHMTNAQIVNSVKETANIQPTPQAPSPTVPIYNKSIMYRTPEDMLELSKSLSAGPVKPYLDLRYIDYYVNPNITRISRDTTTRR